MKLCKKEKEGKKRASYRQREKSCLSFIKKIIKSAWFVITKFFMFVSIKIKIKFSGFEYFTYDIVLETVFLAIFKVFNELWI